MSTSGVRTVQHQKYRGAADTRHGCKQARRGKAWKRPHAPTLPTCRRYARELWGERCYPMGGLDVLAAYRAARDNRGPGRRKGVRIQARPHDRADAGRVSRGVRRSAAHPERGGRVWQARDSCRQRAGANQPCRHAACPGCSLRHDRRGAGHACRIRRLRPVRHASCLVPGRGRRTSCSGYRAWSPERQAGMAKRIIELTVPEPEMNFAWPTPDLLAYEIRNMGKPRKGADAVIAEVVGGGSAEPHIADRQGKAMGDLARTAKDCMIIPRRRRRA